MTFLIGSQRQLAVLQRRCGRASRLALDVEGNGMHVYTPRLCVVQLAWREREGLCVAVIDALRVDLTGLRETLGPAGPLKVVHDLTFDALMLHQVGAPLDRVRDTSVTARFLGIQATGLASLVAAHLDVELEKSLQSHDWSRRPLTPPQLEYLAGDVRHLLDLDDVLQRAAVAKGITGEVAVECEYKLAAAPDAGRKPRSAHERIKGYGDLDDAGKAVLRRLSAAREALAEKQDVPPYRIAPNRALMHLARQRPTTVAQLQRRCGAWSFKRHAERFVAAVVQGLADGPPPPAEPAPVLDRGEIRLRKALRAAILAWRRARAERREVDLQVVLPGHCVDPVVAALAQAADPEQALIRLGEVPGLGHERVARHGRKLLELRAQALQQSRETGLEQ